MSNPHRTPSPIDPISYREVDDARPLLPVLRILIFALILLAACGLISEITRGWQIGYQSVVALWLRWPKVGGATLLFEVLLLLAEVCVDLALLAAAIAYLKRSNVARLLAIICCWLKVGLNLAYGIMAIVVVLNQLGARPSYWTYLSGSLAYTVAFSLLPAAAALILATPPMRRMFFPKAWG